MPSHDDKSANIGYSFAFISSFFSAVTTVLGKWNLEQISVLAMNALIFSVAAILFSLILIPRHGLKAVFHLSSKGWLWTLLFALSSWLAIWLYWMGVNEMDPSLASLLNRSEVLVAIFLGIIFLKERFSKLETIGTILAIAGIVVMRLTLRFEYSDGFIYMLAGSFFFGITEFMSKIAVRHVAPTVLAYIRNSILAVLFWISVWIYEVEISVEGNLWIGIIALGLIGPGASRWVYLLALKRVDLSKVAIISQIQPAFVLAIAALFLHDLPTLRESIGGVLLMAGSLMIVSGRYPLIKLNHNSAKRSDTAGV